MSTALTCHLQTQLAQLPAGPIAVAFSGGMDSTVLLHALASLPGARARGLRALHIDHGLQPQSGQWSGQCREAAACLGVAFESIGIDSIAVSGRGVEDAARAARYSSLAARLGAGEVLAVAHHADDQAETVLLKLLRGAGPEGLGGMRALRVFGAGLLWRPMLDLPRGQLHAYATSHTLHWIDDPSNDNTQLRRNFLRAEILPRLRQRWPDATAAIGHSARWAVAAAQFIDQEAARALARLQGVDPTTLAWRGWLDLPEALRDPVLRRWLRILGMDEPAHFHVTELERQLRDAAEDSIPCVSWERSDVRRYRDLIYAMHRQPPLPADWQATWQSDRLALPDGSRLEWHSHNGKTMVGHAPPLNVRYRHGGERIRPADAMHTRELRLLLQEAGVPPWQRDRIPLIHAGTELIVVGDIFLSTDGRRLYEQLQARIVWMRSGEGGLRAEG
ncbi:MAG TPA: tRNA lysidine(34) synthetase TilS [Rudaea sp.]|jgi:tRNA(Ile)-lysidine synthase